MFFLNIALREGRRDPFLRLLLAGMLVFSFSQNTAFQNFPWRKNFLSRRNFILSATNCNYNKENFKHNKLVK